MDQPITTTKEILSHLASASEQGSAPLYYDKLTERQKSAIRTALGDTWIDFGEIRKYGQFTIQLLGTTTKRFISVIEKLPEPIEN